MIKVNEKYKGKRLDVFLLNFLKKRGYAFLSRNLLTKNWEGLVNVNGKCQKQSYKLRLGDEVELNIEEVEKIEERISNLDELESQLGELDILFESEDFLILEKPKGVVVHPGAGNRKDTLANYVKGYLESKGEFDGKVQRAGIVHRLDKGVGGLIVFAKSLKMQKYLQKQFENHSVRKIYLAQIEYKELKNEIRAYFHQEGIKSLDIDDEIAKLEESNFSFDSTWLKAEGYIKRSSKDRIKMEFRKYLARGGKKAVTYLKPINDDRILLVIETGRMHQIRATLEYFGIGIVGDTLYGVNKSSSLPEDIELKSIYLSFEELDGSNFTIIKY
jgi:23S rRNA pseudouridine1911/1915/1917 synthase